MREEITAGERNYLLQLGKTAKEASFLLREVPTGKKNQALKHLISLIKEHVREIQRENAKDLDIAQMNALPDALIDRLYLSEKVIQSMIDSLEAIISLPDPVGEIIEGRVLPNGLRLKKIRVPLGVLAVIYESRPNVTIDVGALAIKSSNAVILRGGKEAFHSNRILV